MITQHAFQESLGGVDLWVMLGADSFWSVFILESRFFKLIAPGSSRIDLFPLGPCVTGTHECFFLCRFLFFKAYF